MRSSSACYRLKVQAAPPKVSAEAPWIEAVSIAGSSGKQRKTSGTPVLKGSYLQLQEMYLEPCL